VILSISFLLALVDILKKRSVKFTEIYHVKFCKGISFVSYLSGNTIRKLM